MQSSGSSSLRVGFSACWMISKSPLLQMNFPAAAIVVWGPLCPGLFHVGRLHQAPLFSIILGLFKNGLYNTAMSHTHIYIYTGVKSTTFRQTNFLNFFFSSLVQESWIVLTWSLVFHCGTGITVRDMGWENCTSSNMSSVQNPFLSVVWWLVFFCWGEVVLLNAVYIHIEGYHNLCAGIMINQPGWNGMTKGFEHCSYGFVKLWVVYWDPNFHTEIMNTWYYNVDRKMIVNKGGCLRSSFRQIQNLNYEP